MWRPEDSEQVTSICVLVETVLWKHSRKPNFLKLLNNQSRMLRKCIFLRDFLEIWHRFSEDLFWVFLKILKSMKDLMCTFKLVFGSLVMENRLLVLACGSSYIINNVYNKSAKDQLLILSQWTASKWTFLEKVILFFLSRLKNLKQNLFPGSGLIDDDSA